MTRILVTGADGCLGQAIVKGLRETGHSVHGQVFARDAQAHETRLDLTDAAATASLPEDIDVVVHVAGNVNPKVPRARMFAINAGGTRNMLAWARQTGVKHFIQISSVSVYGRGSTGPQRLESHTPRQRYKGVAYARSKAAAEKAVEQSGLPYSILRLPMVIGHGDVFATPVIAGSLQQGRFFIPGDGRATVSVLCVENAGRMLAAVVAAGPSACAMNVADHHLSWRDLTAAYAQELSLPFTPKLLAPPGRDFPNGLSGWLFLLGYGRKGGEFPTGRLQQHIGPVALDDWWYSVKAGLASWQQSQSSL